MCVNGFKLHNNQELGIITAYILQIKIKGHKEFKLDVQRYTALEGQG